VTIPVTFAREERLIRVDPAAGATTVRPSVAVRIRVPEVPVTVMLAFPAVAELFAVSVRVLAEVVLTGLKAAVTPAGNPDAAILTVEVKPLMGAIDTVALTAVLLGAVNEPLDTVRLKLGATMVNVRDTADLIVPEVPVTVTVALPARAALLAVRVSVLAVAVLAGLKAAVTPAGSPEAARLTLAAKPLCGTTVIVPLALLAGFAVRVAVEAVRLKPGTIT